MKVNSVQRTPFYTKEEVKKEGKAALLSAGLSAGLTLAVNKGQNASSAARVGLLAGGISIVLGIIHKLIVNAKIKKAEKQENI